MGLKKKFKSKSSTQIHKQKGYVQELLNANDSVALKVEDHGLEKDCWQCPKAGHCPAFRSLVKNTSSVPMEGNAESP